MGAPINGDVVTSVTEAAGTASQLAEETVKKCTAPELTDLLTEFYDG